jgi:hypothetical protein
MSATIIISLIFLFIYFVPAIIGSDKKHSAGIAILNLFLGWTFIGWAIALIWAVSSEKNGNDFYVSKQPTTEEPKDN